MLGFAVLVATIACSSAGSPGTTLEVTPASLEVAPREEVQFAATLAGVPNPPVAWSVEPGGGTIDSTGRYTAPLTEGTFTVTASVSAPVARSQTARIKVSHDPTATSPSTPSTPPPAGVVPAFPGAEGGGSLSKGGRGGAVYQVTNLNDSGTGSLRACVNASGPRTCVFTVGGHITLLSKLVIVNPYITIAGQTAPGGGIEISSKARAGATANYNDDLITIDGGAHDVIIRYIRLRQGLNSSGGSGIGVNHGIYNVMIDHISFAWGVWDNISLYSVDSGFRNMSVQWSVLAEPLWNVNGSVQVNVSGQTPAIADACKDVDFHHNMFSSFDHRGPTHRTYSGRMVNNLVYNWNYYASKGKGYKDFIGNYFKPGPMNGNPTYEIQTWTSSDSNATTVPPSLYVTGNAGPHNSYDPSKDNWASLIGMAQSGDVSDVVTGNVSTTYRRGTPMCALGESSGCTAVGSPGLAITVHPATALAQANGVLLPQTTSEGRRGVGASSKLNDSACDGTWVDNRDSVDTRLVNEAINGTGASSHITADGTFPTLAAGTPCKDTDGDGMPDAYELAHGLNPNDARDGQTLQADGYTNLEHYLNGQ